MAIEHTEILQGGDESPTLNHIISVYDSGLPDEDEGNEFARVERMRDDMAGDVYRDMTAGEYEDDY